MHIFIYSIDDALERGTRPCVPPEVRETMISRPDISNKIYETYFPNKQVRIRSFWSHSWPFQEWKEYRHKGSLRATP